MSTTATESYSGHLEEVRRVNVPISSVPKFVRDAFVATEDRRFYEHNGLDWHGVLRAFARNFSAGGIRQGFSTITMQVAHNSFLHERYHGRSLRRKLVELRHLATPRARADEGPDPRALPQRHLPRQRREWRRGGEPRSVRQERQSSSRSPKARCSPRCRRRRRRTRRGTASSARRSAATSCSASWPTRATSARRSAQSAERRRCASPRTSGVRR